MRKPRAVLGWDIGGAHVKVALVRDGRLSAVRQWPCALWQGLHLLDPVIDEALALRKPSLPPGSESAGHVLTNPATLSDAGTDVEGGLEHAVTMTGEMVDLFESRQDGVIRLVLHLRQRLGPRLHLFCGRGEWVDSAAAGDCWEELASANWAATARLAALHLDRASRADRPAAGRPAEAAVAAAVPGGVVGQDPEGSVMLVDIGSTTTDLIFLARGKVLAAGRNDAERLRSGELLYQGVVRTPLCALAQQIAFRAQAYNVMNEWFATTADVYRLTGELDSGHDQHPAADGGTKSVEGSCRRIARMIGHDAQDASLKDWVTFAHEWRRLQLALLESGIQTVQQSGLPPPFGATPPDGLTSPDRMTSPDGATPPVGTTPPGRTTPPTSSTTLIGAGCGGFLVRAVAQRTGRAYLDFAALVDAPEALRGWVDVCAPAVAVALLRDQAGGAAA